MPANLRLATAFVDLTLKGATAVVAGLNNIRKSVVSTLQPLNDNFASAQSQLMGFVAAASPQAMNTFAGSSRLLSAVLGNALIPHIMKASGYIQQLAQYIKNMDPDTKQQIASWVSYGVAVMGAVVVFTKLNSVFGMILQHPIAATFLAVSAAILKVNADMDKMIEKMNEAVGVMQRMKKGIYTEAEYKQSAAAAIEAGEGSNEDKLKQAEAIRARLTAEVKAQSKEGIDQGSLGATTDYVKGMFGLTNKTDELQTSIQQKLKEAGMIDDLIDRLKKGKKATFTNKEDIDKNRGGGLASGFASAGSGMGGQTTSLEGAFMANAQAALAQDELQQKLLQAQLDGNLEAQKAAVNTERAATALERMQLP